MKKNQENQLFTLTAHFKGAEAYTPSLSTVFELLKPTGLSLIDAVRLCLELHEASGGGSNLSRLRYFIQLGAKALKEEERSVSFEEAVNMTLKLKKNRSERTLRDIRQTMSKLMHCEQGLAQRSVRSISSYEWTRILNQSYAHSPSRYIKARANLSGVYSIAYKQGWCAENPIKKVHNVSVCERTIEPLRLNEIKSLLITAQHNAHRACLPALALMLYTGVRPDEVQRLTWNDIDWEESHLSLAARHTKTGGGRHIPIIRPLLRLLKKEQSQGPICPKGWTKRWQYLRQVAGFNAWVPDILRHSYASYHAKMHQNLPLLQLAMGHRDSRLLLTRYINMRGITKKDAQRFWKAEWLSS